MKTRFLSVTTVCFVMAAIFLAGSLSGALATELTTGAVCPHGNVKYEVPEGYEYTDGSATVSGDENQVCWSATSGFQVTGVCIKIGGPGGGSLIWEGPGDGCGGPYDYGISHVVVNTEETPPPPCQEVDTHYGEWSEWSEWGECINGEQTRTKTREIWTTDKYDPSIECDRWTETESDTQWCDLCIEVETHYGEWSDWSDWSECCKGEHSRTRTREVWTTDINHPEVECDRWVETETQTEPCDLCDVVDTHYGEWSEWGEWSECENGEQSRTRTREVWTTDHYHPEYECDRWIETDTETRECGPELCEVVDYHYGKKVCDDWTECFENFQNRTCVQEVWTTDHFDPSVECDRWTEETTEERPCEEPPEDKTPAGQVELIFSCPVLEGYSLYNFDPVNNVPLGESLFDIPGPCGPDECKIHPRGGYWRFAEPVLTMLTNGRIDSYGEYWIYMVCWSEADGWWPVGFVRPKYYEVDEFPNYPIRWWVEAWADRSQTPSSFDHEWYQVIVPSEWYLVGLK
ncbi:hypothetical protein AMJ51_02675 [Microgenomates bacterium DG_75]|nr:MAG: hypothetical protein AMJ51_02675 [Microgenomates bacterium DG_75]